MSAEDRIDALDLSELEAAADWFDRLDKLSPAEMEAFGAWLRSSARHAAAFDRMVRTLEDSALAEAAAQFKPAPVRSLRQRETAMPTGPQRKPARRKVSNGPWVWTAAAIAACAAVLMAPLSGPNMRRPAPAASSPAPKPEVYATAVGARSNATLNDRSVLYLNADSKLQVLYSSGSRKVMLERGEAMFDVAHDPARPFDVVVDDAKVTAVGTLFDVERINGALEVHVFRGAVRVTSPQGAATLVRRGEWLTLDGDRRQTVGRFDADLSQTWRSDWLKADDMPLRDVVARLNRYSSEKIVLDGPALSDATVTGRFDLTKTKMTVALIARLLDLSAVSDKNHIHLTEKNENAGLREGPARDGSQAHDR